MALALVLYVTVAAGNHYARQSQGAVAESDNRGQRHLTVAFEFHVRKVEGHVDQEVIVGALHIQTADAAVTAYEGLGGKERCGGKGCRQ